MSIFTVNKQIYKYDIFNEADTNCRECRFVRDANLFEIYCIKSGHIVQDRGYCNYAERKTDIK